MDKYSAQQLFAADHPEGVWEAASNDQHTFYEKKVRRLVKKKLLWKMEKDVTSFLSFSSKAQAYICNMFDRAAQRMTVGADVLGLDDDAIHQAIACLRALDTGGFLK